MLKYTIRIAAVAGLLLCAGPARSQSAKLAPHPQANLPPLTFPEFKLPRTPDQIRALYKFAAEHPEVLSYMPCFCGCNNSGHHHNEDCFVKSRDAKGDVKEWQEHGMVCAMCLAVAERSKQMFDQGASLKDIRADIEKRFGNITEYRTATPQPPAK
jgi:hypothetical protein